MAIIAVMSMDDRRHHYPAPYTIGENFTGITAFADPSTSFSQETLVSSHWQAYNGYIEYKHPTDDLEEMTISLWVGLFTDGIGRDDFISTYWIEGQRNYSLQNMLHWIAGRGAPPYMGLSLTDNINNLATSYPTNNLLTHGVGTGTTNYLDSAKEAHFNSRINWHHICYTMRCNNTSGAIKIYIDGQLYMSEGLITNSLPESSLGFEKFNVIRINSLTPNTVLSLGKTFFDDIIISDTYDDPVLVGKCLRLAGLNSALTGSDSYSNETPQDWSTSVPSASHSAMIDVDDWDDNYIKTDVSGNSDVFSISYTPLDASPAPDILGIVAQTTAKHYFHNFDLSDILDQHARCIYFGNAGTELYVLDTGVGQGWIIHQFTLGTAYDIESWISPNYKVFEFNLAPETQFLPTWPWSISFNSSGTRLYVSAERTVADAGDEPIYQFDLTSAWDIETVQLVESPLVYFDFGNVADISSHVWNSTGSKLWILTSSFFTDDSRVREYNAGTNWDITTLTLAATSPLLTDLRYHGFNWNNNGTKAIFWNWEDDNVALRKGWIHIYNIGTPYDISYIDPTISPTYTTCDLFRYPQQNMNADLLSNYFDVTDIKFSSNGDTLFILWDSSLTNVPGAHQIRAYNLDSAYDVSSVNFGKYANLIGTSSGVVENATVRHAIPDRHSDWVTLHDWYPQNPQSSSDWTVSDLQDLFIGVKSK